MQIYKSPAALLMRSFRLRNNLTLHQASPLLDTSPSALSRKERGEKPVERTDIRNAIDAYGLTPWESYELWIAAGFVPEQRKPYLSHASMCEMVRPLLGNVTYPAAITDQVGHIKAWNDPYEKIWKLADTVPTPHCIEEIWRRKDLFLSHDSWNRHVLHSLKLFYNKTLRATGKPELENVLKHLRRTYGEAFARRWDQAQNHALLFDFVNETPSGDSSSLLDTYGVTLVHDFSLQAGRPMGIEYLTMQSMVEVLADYEMTIYLPFGETNQKRYESWYRRTFQGEGGRVHCI